MAEIRARGDRAVLKFHEGRTPEGSLVRELVRLVPAELSFFADGREAMRIGVKSDGPEELLEVTSALLRVLCGSDTLSVSHSGN